MADLAALKEEHEPLPVATDVADFLGWSSSARNLAAIAQHVAHVTALAKAYTRGRGFSAAGTACHPAIHAVIVGATARSVSNPARAYKVVAGSVEQQNARFEGWTILERQTLDRFRVRVA